MNKKEHMGQSHTVLLRLSFIFNYLLFLLFSILISTTLACPPPPQIRSDSSNLKEHGWEMQLSIMVKYAEMKSKGNPKVFLSVMNVFLEQQGIPQIAAPVCQVQGSPSKVNAQTSPTRPVEIIQSYVLPVSPPPPPLAQAEPTTLEEPMQNSSPHTPTSTQNSTSHTLINSRGEATDSLIKLM